MQNSRYGHQNWLKMAEQYFGKRVDDPLGQKFSPNHSVSVSKINATLCFRKNPRWLPKVTEEYFFEKMGI